jgi:hypothetical protein
MDLDQQTWELSHQIRWALVSRNGSVSGPPVGYCTRGQYRTKCRENVYMLRNCHDTKSRIREDSIPPLDPDLNVKRGRESSFHSSGWRNPTAQFRNRCVERLSLLYPHLIIMCTIVRMHQVNVKVICLSRLSAIQEITFRFFLCVCSVIYAHAGLVKIKTANEPENFEIF